MTLSMICERCAAPRQMVRSDSLSERPCAAALPVGGPPRRSWQERLEFPDAGPADSRGRAHPEIAQIACMIALQFLELRLALLNAAATLRQPLRMLTLLFVGDALNTFSLFALILSYSFTTHQLVRTVRHHALQPREALIEIHAGAHVLLQEALKPGPNGDRGINPRVAAALVGADGIRSDSVS